MKKSHPHFIHIQRQIPAVEQTQGKEVEKLRTQKRRGALSSIKGKLLTIDERETG
jgi:hypothetical protein